MGANRVDDGPGGSREGGNGGRGRRGGWPYDPPVVRGALHAASHLAVWAGLYVVGALVFLAQVSGIDGGAAAGARVRAAAFAFCTAAGVYLLDRVKLRDAWLDPADAEAHPERFAFLSRRSRLVRALIVALLALAVWTGESLSVWGALAPALAAAGVLVYAGRPRRAHPRPKDLVFLKNGYVALGITGFSVVVACAAASPHASVGAMRDFMAAHWTTLAIASALLLVRVAVDASLCDLDDEDSDRRHGTGTLPTHVGRTKAWNIAAAVRLGVAAALAVIPALPAPERFAWAGATALSTLALRAAAPARVRDWVDASFALEAAVVTGVVLL